MIDSLYTPHKVDGAKLEAVTADMARLGAPTIRVVDCGDHYMALEGCHRLAAAAALGIAPNLVILEQEDLVDADTLDIDGLERGETYTAGEVAGNLHDTRNPVYTISHDGRLIKE